MKKIISLLLCLAMLFAFAAIGTAETIPQLTVITTYVNLFDNSDTHFQIDILRDNFDNFESFELLITYNPDVLELSYYPVIMQAVPHAKISCNVIAPGQLQVICRDANEYATNYLEPFAMKVIGAGDTNIAVTLVSYNNTDGPVENIDFTAVIQNVTVPEFYVRYDLDGDELVSAEDARLALRFAVGIDIPTDAQCRAAGVLSADQFTAETARLILRYSLGLEP